MGYGFCHRNELMEGVLYNNSSFRMENAKSMDNNLRISEQISEIDEVQLEMVCQRKFRKHKLSNIKIEIQNQLRETSRKSQNVAFFLLNLAFILVVSCLNAYSLLEVETSLQLKSILFMGFVSAGIILQIIASLRVASFWDVLKLYLMVDSLVPVIIAAMIGFYSIINFTSAQLLWHHKMSLGSFPVWIICIGGYLRVMVARAKYAPWEIVVTKLVFVVSGLVFFYIGFQYMNGAYKITGGFLTEFEYRFRDMVYLYVFGCVQLFFEYYRRLSYFDQTEELRFNYSLRDNFLLQQQQIYSWQLKNMQKMMIEQQLRQLIADHRVNPSRVSVSVSNPSNSNL